MVVKKQARGKATAERLLDAAMDVYADRGPEGFTATAVVETSGVSVGSLYHHFGSFDGLAAALFARCSTELIDTLAEAIRPQQEAKAGVHAFVTAYLRWCVEHRDGAHLMLALPYLGHLRVHTEQLLDETVGDYAAIAAWFAPHIEAGRIAALPQHLLECLVIGPITELVTRWLIGMPGVDIDEAFDLLPERVWQTIKGTEA